MDTGELFELALQGTAPQGGRIQARRDAMRAGLLTQVDRRRTRRVASRSVAGAILLAVGLALVWPNSGPATREALGTRHPATIVVVRDDPSTLQRLAVRPGPGPRIAIVRSRPIRPSTLLDDRQLVRWLGDAGHPAAVVRIGEQVLLSDPVTE